ncbi:MAG: hypothetical protein JWL76_2272 [Thermoleophilia bacterium]|nr:hypothetical protein [Thermoleophilia bacterium]
MQADDGNKIRARWKESGGGTCAHGDYEKEYYLGADTGDYVCKSCGETWMRGTKPPGAGAAGGQERS